MGHALRWLKKNLINAILLAVFFTGIGLIAYPTVSNWYNSYHQSVAVIEYAENIAALSKEDLEAAWDSAVRYNEEVRKLGNSWDPNEERVAAYMKELNVYGKGIMGYIQIPKIDVMIPVYHTTEDRVLQKGIGHMPGTSLPVGGEGSHAILSGHRGLPSAKLFTDLDKLTIGDKFQLNILDKSLTYEVDQIRIVDPTDFSNLLIDNTKDYCTLFTCTPYGINSHRLLVRGHRIQTANGSVDVPSDALQYEPVLIAPFFASPILFLALVWMIITTSSRRKLRRSREKALSEVMEGTGTVVSKGDSRKGASNGK